MRRKRAQAAIAATCAAAAAVSLFRGEPGHVHGERAGDPPPTPRPRSCPGGVAGLGRCWVLGATSESCGDACKAQGLSYSYVWSHRAASDSLPNRSALAALLGASAAPSPSEQPFAPVECWDKQGRVARPAADPAAPPVLRRRRSDPRPYPPGGRAGDFASATCQFACPCASVVRRCYGCGAHEPQSSQYWSSVDAIRVHSGCTVDAVEVREGSASSVYGQPASPGEWSGWIAGPVTALEARSCRQRSLCRLRLRSGGVWHGPFGVAAPGCDAEPILAETEVEWVGLGELLSMRVGSSRFPVIDHVEVQWRGGRGAGRPRPPSPAPEPLPAGRGGPVVCFLHFHKTAGTQICDLLPKDMLTPFQKENNCNLDEVAAPWAEGRPAAAADRLRSPCGYRDAAVSLR
eukprot:TRINITY_DN22404_c0_g1_i2.p1 TRINITY_DN22404_c0_g1~~TRINITY_DN22404_c0_g1_i2.p1  ORF type:complete len:404 (+),score=95.91 TRINITY_DN22404_c0_g1_i2:48-1259(+)